MSKKTIVRFLRPWATYGAGEVAGFAPHVADKLLSNGFAALNEPAPPPAPDPAPPADLSEQTDAGDPPKPAPAAAAKKSTTSKKSS